MLFQLLSFRDIGQAILLSNFKIKYINASTFAVRPYQASIVDYVLSEILCVKCQCEIIIKSESKEKK